MLVLKGATTSSSVAAPVVPGAFLFLPASHTPEDGLRGQVARPAHGVDQGCLGDEPWSTRGYSAGLGLQSVRIREIN